MEIIGILKNARRVAKGEDPSAPCLSGDVYGDTKGRFCDGERITTSTIMSEEGNVFQTRLSAYRVESWAPDKDGWIEWLGGERPVLDGAEIAIRFRGEGRVEEWPCARPEQLELDHQGGSGDIVAYRAFPFRVPPKTSSSLSWKRGQCDGERNGLDWRRGSVRCVVLNVPERRPGVDDRRMSCGVRRWNIVRLRRLRGGSQMTAIPEGVMTAAWRPALEAVSQVHTLEAAQVAIARAILAERRRCADLAKLDADDWRDTGFPAQAMGAIGVRKVILESIAS